MKFSNLKKINFLFLFIIIILSIIGFIALFSASNGNIEPWAKKHIIRFCICFLILIFISLININFWYKHAYNIFLLCLLLLATVEIIGSIGLGAKRWLHIFGVSIQPSELIKVAIILALSRYFHDLKISRIGKIQNSIIPLIIIIIPFLFVLFQPDLGTSIMILLLGLSIMFASGVRIWKFMLGFIVFLISMPFFWDSIQPYQQKRVISFLNPELDPMGAGYHLIQSKIALGSGGVIGKGFLQGTQSYLDYLPEKQTDFIFTLIGEEFGFIGMIFILILFMLIIAISYYISFNSNNVFGKILSVGVSINIFLYVLLNTAMITGLMPIVGVPLPLISYGGTALLSIMISFGLLMNISVYGHLKKIN
jgi:rod shape determining protein RodA